MRERRQFTPDEDALIMSQAAGHLPITALEKRLHAHRLTLMTRAHELGVKLKIKPHRVNSTPRDNGTMQHTEIAADFSKNPLSVGGDPLLYKLQLEHGNRRYDSLQVRRAKCTHSSTAS